METQYISNVDYKDGGLIKVQPAKLKKLTDSPTGWILSLFR